MAVIFTQDFDQADGLAITTANSANSGNAFGSVATTGLAITYSTAQKAKGTASMKVATTASPASGSAVAQRLGSPKTFSWRFYFLLSGLPSLPTALVTGYCPPLANGWGQTLTPLAVTQDGRVGFQIPDGAGGTKSYYTAASTFSPTLNHWYRCEGTIVMDPSVGSVLYKVFDGDSTTPLLTTNPTGIYTADASNPGLVQVQFGKNTSSPTINPFWIDAIQLRDDATLPGPYLAAAPTVQANAGLSGAVLTLSTTPSTYDHVVASTTWTQTAGPAVSLSSASAPAPVSLTVAGSYTFHVDITDDLGRHAVDDVNFTYSGNVSAPGLTGTVLAGQWLALLTATPSLGNALTWSTTSPGVTLAPNGSSCIAYGPSPSVATPVTVHLVEASNSNTTDYRFTVPGTPTTQGGVRILQATADQSAGGVFQ